MNMRYSEGDDNCGCASGDVTFTNSIRVSTCKEDMMAKETFKTMPALLTFPKQMSPVWNDYLKSQEPSQLDEFQAGPSNYSQTNTKDDINTRLQQHKHLLEDEGKEFLEAGVAKAINTTLRKLPGVKLMEQSNKLVRVSREPRRVIACKQTGM